MVSGCVGSIEITTIGHTKFSAAVVSSEGHIMHPHFRHGAKVLMQMPMSRRFKPLLSTAWSAQQMQGSITQSPSQIEYLMDGNVYIMSQQTYDLLTHQILNLLNYCICGIVEKGLK